MKVSLANQKMKAVTSKGGTVQFRVPEHWTVADEGDDMLYYEEASGTLRLTVMSRFLDRAANTELPTGNFKSLVKKYNSTVTRLAENRFMATHVLRSREDGAALYQPFWLVEARQGNTLTLAIFSYTLLEGEQDEAAHQDEIKMIEREIRALTVEQPPPPSFEGEPPPPLPTTVDGVGA